jgi:hypothetical protein
MDWSERISCHLPSACSIMHNFASHLLMKRTTLGIPTATDPAERGALFTCLFWFDRCTPIGATEPQRIAEAAVPLPWTCLSAYVEQNSQVSTAATAATGHTVCDAECMHVLHAPLHHGFLAMPHFPYGRRSSVEARMHGPCSTQVQAPDTSAHSVFYATVQATLYCLCFWSARASAPRSASLATATATDQAA